MKKAKKNSEEVSGDVIGGIPEGNTEKKISSRVPVRKYSSINL